MVRRDRIFPQIVHDFLLEKELAFGCYLTVDSLALEKSADLSALLGCEGMLVDDFTREGIDDPCTETAEPISERTVLELRREHVCSAARTWNAVDSLFLAFLEGVIVPGTEPGLVTLKDGTVEIQRDYLDFILVKHGFILPHIRVKNHLLLSRTLCSCSFYAFLCDFMHILYINVLTQSKERNILCISSHLEGHYGQKQP
jgi:hypothetical protein